MENLRRLTYCALSLYCIGFGLFYIFSAAERCGAAAYAAPFVASVGVFVALFIGVYQQQRNDVRENEKFNRKSVAARAVLPLSLMQICKFSEECIKICLSIERSAEKEEAYNWYSWSRECADAYNIPVISDTVSKNIQECIENGIPKEVEPIFDLTSDIQVYHSRLEGTIGGFRSRGASYRELDDRIIEGLLIYCQASAIFEYARRENESKFDFDGCMYITARMLGMSEVNYPTIHKLIAENNGRRI